MPKKLTVKDLKRDELVETVGQWWVPALAWMKAHRRELTWGIGSVLVLLLLVGVIGSYRQATAVKAQNALGDALLKLSEAENAAAGAGRADWAGVRAAFEVVADEHGGTPALVARHYVGVLKLREGDAVGAVAELSEAAGGRFDPWRTPLSLSALAAAQEQAGDHAEAEATWKQLRARDAVGFPADAAAMELARFYERQGRLDEARALYAQLAAETELETEFETELELQSAPRDPPSVFAPAAQARLDELEG